MEYTKLKFINQYKSESINPAKTPDTVFEMYSVPIYETGHPEFLRGDEIASNKAVVQKNDILLCKINPRINRVWVVSDESDKMNIASSEWIVIRNSEYNPEFLAWYFRTPKFQKLMTSEVTGIGGSLTRAQPKCVAEYPVPVLDRVKQDEIVAILNKCKFIIESRKQELDALDDLIKARFIELFGDCKNEVLIGDVISISRGASPRPISAFITDREDGVNWIKIGDVSENSLYIMKTEERITPEGAKKSRMVHKGDFILSNSMSFGRPYILGINGCVHDGWLIMSDFKETFNELYLYHAIRSDDVQYQFSGKVNGATVKNLNSDLVKKTFIKVPPMELQNQFATFAERTDKSKVAVKKALDEAQLLFDSLMQKYFG